MNSPIEINQKFEKKRLETQKRFEATLAGYRKRYPEFADAVFYANARSRAIKYRDHLFGIVDHNHTAQSDYRKNNFLSDFLYQGYGCTSLYKALPYGYFFVNDVPKLRKWHQKNAGEQPKLYLYRAGAFDYDQEKLIELLARFTVLSDFYNTAIAPATKAATVVAATQNEQSQSQNEPLKTEKTKAQDAAQRQQILREATDLLNRDEVAAWLRKAPSTISRWAKEGIIKSILIRGKYMFFRKDIEEWLAKK